MTECYWYESDLKKNDIFGEALFKIYMDREFFVVAKKNSKVLFYPYDDIETLPELKLGLGISESKSKQSHISYRTAEIIKKFDFQELPMVDQLIADLYVLDTRARKDLFSSLKTLKDNYSEPDKVEEIKKIKYKW